MQSQWMTSEEERKISFYLEKFESWDLATMTYGGEKRCWSRLIISKAGV